MRMRSGPAHALVCLLVTLFCVAGGRCLRADDITVLAAATFSDVLVELAPAFEKKTGHHLRFGFGGSGTLARQIREGARADVFISADADRMDLLEAGGWIKPGTRRDVVANRLVLVAPEAAAVPLTRVEDLAGPAVRRVALGEPATVPAGTYARLFLEERGLWRPLAAKWVPLDSVRAVLAAVESGNVDAGFVYQTDALRSRRVRLVGGPLESERLRIVHPGAVVSGSRLQGPAERFLDYLREEAAVLVLRREGFLTPEAPVAP